MISPRRSSRIPIVLSASFALLLGATGDHCSRRVSASESSATGGAESPVPQDLPQKERLSFEEWRAQDTRPPPPKRTEAELEAANRRATVLREGGTLYSEDGEPVLIVEIDPDGSKKVMSPSKDGWRTSLFQANGDVIVDGKVVSIRPPSYPMRVVSTSYEDGDVRSYVVESDIDEDGVFETRDVVDIKLGTMNTWQLDSKSGAWIKTGEPDRKLPRLE